MSSDAGGRAFVYLVIGFFAGIYYFYGGLNSFRLKRLVENTPTSKVRSVALGLVEVYGEVVIDTQKRDYNLLLKEEKEKPNPTPYFDFEPDANTQFLLKMALGETKPISGVLKSPLNKKDCVYYCMKIEEVTGGKNSHWATILKDEARLLFNLKDETGSVLVNPMDADIDISQDFKKESGFFQGDPPERVLKYLIEKKIKHDNLFHVNKRMRFLESYIAPGDKIYILGTAAKNPFAKDSSSTNSSDLIIIKKGLNPCTYYISDNQEYKLRHKLTNEVMLKVYGGAALSIICLGMILLMLKII